MKNAAIIGGLFCLTLAGCSGLQANPNLVNSASELQAQAGQVLASGNVSCLPANKPCGSYVLEGRPTIGGNIVPAFTFTGDKAIGAALGQGFKATFPSSGYTKFYVNSLLLDVGPLDPNLYGKTLNFGFESSSVDNKGVYTFSYVAQ